MAFGVSVYRSSALMAPHVADDRIDARIYMNTTVITCCFAALQLSEMDRQNQTVPTCTVLTPMSVCSVCACNAEKLGCVML